jgi:hypothetical protein
MVDFISDALSSYQYYAILGVFIFVYFFCFKEDVLNLFDPMIMLLMNLVSSGTFVTWMWMFGYIKFKYLVAYIICVTFFIIGTKRISFKKLYTKGITVIGEDKLIWRKDSSLLSFDFRLLFVFLIIISIIHFTTIYFISITTGLAIFDETSAADARVAINAAFRWGFVILDGSRNIGLISSCFLALYGSKGFKRVLCYLIAVAYVLSFISSGNKAAIFNIAFVLGSLIVYIESIGLRSGTTIRWFIKISLGLGFSYFSYAMSSIDNSGNDPLSKFFFRIALSGDAYTYFFAQEQYEILKYTYNLPIYLLHNITAPLGLKLVEYNIGSAMYAKATGDYTSGFGPNPQFVTEGMIFLGIYLAPIYTYGIGYFYSFVRKYFLGRAGNLNFLSFNIAFISSNTIPIDINYAFFNIISSVLVISVSYLLSVLFCQPLAQEKSE